jgi:hypothetical protein
MTWTIGLGIVAAALYIHLLMSIGLALMLISQGVRAILDNDPRPRDGGLACGDSPEAVFRMTVHAVRATSRLRPRGS